MTGFPKKRAMALGGPIPTDGLAFQKPEPRKRAKGRKRAKESAVIAIVRARDVERDGYCRIGRTIGFGECSGPSQWAHLRGSTRAETRGKPADERHTTTGTMMLCKAHHDRYDGRTGPRLNIRIRDGSLGADGKIDFGWPDASGYTSCWLREN